MAGDAVNHQRQGVPASLPPEALDQLCVCDLIIAKLQARDL
ncbi:hypothetical protein ACFLWZ_03350 [Chloroflexota bacterium]